MANSSRRSIGSPAFIGALLLLGLVWLVVIPRVRGREECGRAGNARCPPPGHENGIGKVIPKAEACADSGYLCLKGGMLEDGLVLRWDLRRGVLYVRAPLPPDLSDEDAHAM